MAEDVFKISTLPQVLTSTSLALLQAKVVFVHINSTLEFNMSINIKTLPNSDYEAVKAAVGYYIEALKTLDKSTLDLAFHKDGTMTGWSPDGSLSIGTYKNLHAYFDLYGAPKNLKTHIDVLGLTPTSAVVRVEIEGAADAPYTDFHTLLKSDGEWKIIAKVFHAYES